MPGKPGVQPARKDTRITMAKRGVNSVTIIGTMGADPKVHQFPNGSTTVVSLATSESWNDKQSGAKTEDVEWHRVVLKGRHGELVAQHGHKGRELYVLGKNKTRKYTAGGVERSITEIIVDPYDGQCHFMDSKGDQGGTAQAGRHPRNVQPAPRQPQDQQSADQGDLTPPSQMFDGPAFDPAYYRGVPS